MLGETTLWAARKRGGVYPWASPLLRVLKAFLPPNPPPRPLHVFGRRRYSLAGELVVLLFPCPRLSCSGLWQTPVGWSALDPFQWHVGCSWREPRVLCGQGAFKRAVGGKATSRPGLSLRRAFAWNHGLPAPVQGRPHGEAGVGAGPQGGRGSSFCGFLK